jgi:hypothetical protein
MAPAQPPTNEQATAAVVAQPAAAKSSIGEDAIAPHPASANDPDNKAKAAIVFREQIEDISTQTFQLSM